MQKELREKIINLIVSRDLRKYLLDIQESVSDGDLIETIGAAPISLKKKKRLLTHCARDAEIDGKAQKQAQDIVQDLEKAFSQLYNAKKGTLFMLECYSLCSIRGLQRHMIEDSCRLAPNFEIAKEYMERKLFYHNVDQLDMFDMTYKEERKVHPEKDWKALKQAWIRPPHWFWELYLIDTTCADDICNSDYQFICMPDGEMQYVRSLSRAWGGLSSRWYHPPIPYRSGDILSIDCSPYAPAGCYCLVLETYPTLTKCLYPTLSGKVGFGVIEDGYYYENGDTYRQYLPPLFCAELNESELPGNCVFMLKLSHKLVKNQKLGEILSKRLDSFLLKGGTWTSLGANDMGDINKRGRFDEEGWHIEQEILFEWVRELEEGTDVSL